MRPYNRSLHPDDYGFLKPYNDAIVMFQADMQRRGIPHREWHPHRFWEYSSMMQQLMELGIQQDAEIIDTGAGASFFDPYLALLFPKLWVTDNMKYGDITPMLNGQRLAYGVSLPLCDQPIESMPAFDDNKFDVAMCISSIEHVDDHDAAMSELVRVTKPGGYIFITSDYFRDLAHYDQSVSKHLQVTPYRQEYIETFPDRWPVSFVGDKDFEYKGDFVHNYSFCNICLRRNA